MVYVLLVSVQLDIILPEICAFIISFSCTVWTKTMSLACSLADGVLADASLISPATVFAHRYKTETPFISK